MTRVNVSKIKDLRKRRTVEAAKRTKTDKRQTIKKAIKIESMAEQTPTVIHGKLREYVPGEDVEMYIDHVEDFFVLNLKTIAVDQHVRYFLNAMGAIPFARVSIACKPDKASTKTLAVLKEKFRLIFEQKHNTQVERARFTYRKRLAGESISDFVTQLQVLAEHCNFENNLDDQIKTQFIAGINNQHILSKLLSLPNDSNLTATINKAHEAELIADQSKRMVDANESSVADVNYINYRDQQGAQRSAQNKTRSFSGESSSGEKRNRSSRPRCYRCGSEGHLARFCNKGGRGQKTNLVSQGHFERQRTRSSLNAVYEALENLELESTDEELNDQEEPADTTGDETLNNILGECRTLNNPALVEINVENSKLLMEVDTGAGVSVCSWQDYKKLFAHKHLLPCTKNLKVISGDKIQVKGQIVLRKAVGSEIALLPLIIVKTNKTFTPLLGRNWLSKLKPDWRNTFLINKIDSLKAGADTFWVQQQVKQFKKEFASVFDGNLSTPMKVPPVEIRMKENVVPFVHKPYSVPLAHKEKLEKHLKDLVKSGILEKVEYAEWASPLVVVVKANKTDIRVCMDGSKTVNPFIETHHYPLPLIDDLISCKAGAKKFALLDLKGAYQQLIVSERTKRLLTVNTHLGLFAYRRLPFGVKPAATIFQQVMDKLLADIPNVNCYIDDIFCWAKDNNELAKTLKEVLQRLSENNVKVNPAKCQWFKDSIAYLGHNLSELGVTASRDKLKAISSIAMPKNTTQLKAFIGAVSFYGKFCKNLSTRLAPLFKLLQKNVKWEWNGECQEAFDDCKREICSRRVLTHYDESKDITVTCDASDDGLGAVLSHCINGQERPVLFASRALTKAEKNYPILHREALAIVFAMEKFYRYVFGRRVKIVTDHKPLESIFGERKSKPAVAASRLQRYIVRMSIFDFEISAIKGKDNAIADCLSRLPCKGDVSEKDEDEAKFVSINSVSKQDAVNLNLKLVQRETAADEKLKVIVNFVKTGWPNRPAKGVENIFWGKRDALNVDKDCLTFNDRVVIPTSLRQKALEILHHNHRGEEKMKQVARQFMYWEFINRDIENFSRGCLACQSVSRDKCSKVYSKWPEVHAPMERVHLDFFHYESKSYLVFIDTFSRWLEVKPMSRTTAKDLIWELDKIFATLGYPGTVVSDNGPPFSSTEFADYCNQNDIEQVFSPPYHPQSNGLAERAVGTTKAALKRLMFAKIPSSLQILIELNKFLFTHRNTPTTDGIIPASRILNYTPKTALEKLKRLKNKTFEGTEEIIKTVTDKNTEFNVNDKVLFISKDKGWSTNLEARIIKKLSKHVYWIEFKEKGTRKAHWNQLKAFKPPFFVANSSIQDNTTEDQRDAKNELKSTVVRKKIIKDRNIKNSEPVRRSERLGTNKKEQS